MCLVACPLAPARAGPANLDETGRWQEIERVWARDKPGYAAFAADMAKQRSDMGLYRLQMWTNDLALAAIAARRDAIVRDLLELYRAELDWLTRPEATLLPAPAAGGAAATGSAPIDFKDTKWRLANGKENVLSSAQFIYLLASVVRSLAERTDAPARRFDAFVAQAAPIVSGHLRRWILGPQASFNAQWLGCAPDGFHNHARYLAKKQQRAFSATPPLSTCNAVTDADLWILAGAAELLRTDPQLPPFLRLDAADVLNLKSYVKSGTNLLRGRTTGRTLATRSGTVSYLVFDPGGYKDYPDYAYAGYEGGAFPENKTPRAAAGWDFAHAIRFPLVFTSLMDARAATGLDWPTSEVLGGLARALAYVVFDNEAPYPRFRNYMDGGNGWYRVKPQTNEGFDPWSSSAAILFGGWGRLARHEPALGPVLVATWQLMISREPSAVAWRARYYDQWGVRGQTRRVQDYSLATSPDILPFLATFPVAPPGQRPVQ